MLDLKINDSVITFNIYDGVLRSGYTVDLNELSLQELQNLRSVALKVYFNKLKESSKKENK